MEVHLEIDLLDLKAKGQEEVPAHLLQQLGLTIAPNNINDDLTTLPPPEMPQLTRSEQSHLIGTNYRNGVGQLDLDQRGKGCQAEY